MRKLKSYCSERSGSQLIKLTTSAIQNVSAWRQDCSLILKNVLGLNVHPVKFFEENKRSLPREMPLLLYFTGAYLTGVDLTGARVNIISRNTCSWIIV